MTDLNRVFLSETEKKWCIDQDVKLTYPGEEFYPEPFYQLSHQPHFLFYRGTPVWKTHRLLSVVGSRSPQYSSLNWLDQVLGEFLHDNECAIVSGGARGIDMKAHQMAVRMGRPTVVFVPAGLMQIYPPSFGEWIEPILKSGGCVVSQFLPNADMRKRYFRERNRLIAALSPMTLIVECKRRSGTLLTAKYALEMGKTLGVMPTFPGEFGMGGLDLLYESPALIIRDSADIKLALNNMSKLMN